MNIDLPSLENNTILIVDDDEGVVVSIQRMLEKLGPRMASAFTLKEGLAKLSQHPFDLVFLDVNLPDGSGIEALNEIMEIEPSPLVIIMTAFSDPHGAELAIQHGAWNYIQKPIVTRDIRLQAIRAIQFLEQKQKVSKTLDLEAPDIIGSSDAITQCKTQAAQIAKSNSNVLITGETGTGKELFARAIHQNSRRRGANFTVVDCSVLSKNLIDSVLFGHEKGAFTGADQKRNGLIAIANGGTLFLDEIGELPLPVQASFLRVLQEKKFRPIGSEKESFSDFRLICATNQDLDRMAAENRFRKDLLFRLRSLCLHLPPLRQRLDDIPAIARTCLEHLGAHSDMPVKQASEDFLEALSTYHWPGNVRELVHAIEASVAAAQEAPLLFAVHLPPKIRVEITRSAIAPKPCGLRINPAPSPLQSLGHLPYAALMEQTEKEYLAAVHDIYHGDIGQIVKATGISRAALYRKLKKHGIK